MPYSRPKVEDESQGWGMQEPTLDSRRHPIPVQEPRCGARCEGAWCRKQGAVHGLGVRGLGWGAYSTLNLKNAALSSEANSSTTTGLDLNISSAS